MTEAWYQNVAKLISETDKLYTNQPLLQQLGGKWKVTQDKIVALRRWESSLFLTESNFGIVLQRHNIFYVPKAMTPGPCVVFPLRDFDDIQVRAQTKPMPGSVLEGTSKYMWIGQKTYGPSWLGDSPDMLRRILQLKLVMLVEGPFDFLACQLVAPEVPVLCPLTKRIGGSHEAYLRMLGVKTIYLMFDSDKPEAGKDIGQGQLSMLSLKKQIKTMEVRILPCPAHDPSKALEARNRTRDLMNALRSILSSERVYSSKLLEHSIIG